MSEKILVFEEVEKLASLLEDYLRHNGFEAHRLSDSLKVASWVRENSPKVVLLDTMHPGRCGIELYREIRAFSRVPIITNALRVDEVSSRPDFGAPPSVCRESSPREVVTLVKAVLLGAETERSSGWQGFIAEASPPTPAPRMTQVLETAI
jgi:two-component system, OmpR family, response regulator BaeR